MKLFSSIPHPLWYRIPQSWALQPVSNKLESFDLECIIGTIVRVPFRNSTKLGLVIEACIKFDNPVHFTIKEAISRERIPDDPYYWKFIKKVAHYYHIEPFDLIKRLHVMLQSKAKLDYNSVSNEIIDRPSQIVMLTHEQQKVYDHVAHEIKLNHYAPTLIHGVTGAGKTEVYKRSILTAHASGKSVILLLPEVSLALNFQQILSAQLPTYIPIFGFHSAASVREKKKLWSILCTDISHQQPVVIIGVHLPMLLPIPNLGLIIIDEEHDTGFQEKKHPKINSKEVGVLRAYIYNIVIVLGSATPSLSSLYNTKHKNWKLFSISKRFAGAFPKVKIVSLSQKKQRRSFWVSNELEHAIYNRLEKKEQVILFINRRGFSFFVQCKPCGAIFSCASCSVSLTLHQDNSLHCHYCGYVTSLAEFCTSCGAPESKFIKKGIGTQQMSQIIEKLFPKARIARADLDTTINKKKWSETLKDFQDHKIDILIGTQTITKGYHFPRVTLVGLLWADLNLHFPIYNAAEVSLQQLIQVAGRAGRYSNESDVIVQTLTDHPIFEYVNEIDYPKFFEHEIKNRQLVGYPPCKRLVEIELKHTDEKIVEIEAKFIAKLMKEYVQKNQSPIAILGPAKPTVHKIKNTYAQKILLKSDSMTQLHTLFNITRDLNLKSMIYFTPNPL